MRLRGAVAFFFCLWPCLAADIRGPVLGYVLDGATHRLRTILGIPGAASAGPEIGGAVDLYAAAYSPASNYVLALGGDAQASLLIVPGQPAVPVDGAQGGADQILLSPNGTAAALYFRAAASIEILTGLPAAASVSRSVDLSSLSAAPAALAISDDGAIAAVVNGGAPAVYLFSPDSSISRVALPEPVTALGFLHGTHDLVLTGAADAFLIQDALGAAGIAPLTADGIATPAAVAVTADNAHAFALNSNSGVIVSISLNGDVSALSDCQCTATGLSPLNGTAAFRLTEYSTDPMMIFDASSLDQAPARLWFVPPAQAMED